MSCRATEVSAAHDGDCSPPYASARDRHGRGSALDFVLHDAMMGAVHQETESLCAWPLGSWLVRCSWASCRHRFRRTSSSLLPIATAATRSPDCVLRRSRCSAGEQVILRVTANRGKSWNRDGSIHGFSLLRAKDRSRVDGWDLLFKPGNQEFTLTAPSDPGEYVVVCTVICSEEHEGMHMKFTVLP